MLRRVKNTNEKMLLGYTSPDDYNVYIQEPGEEIITVSESVKEDVIKIFTNNISLYCSHEKIHGYMRTSSSHRSNTCIEPADINGKDLYENTQYKLFDRLGEKEKEIYQLLFNKVIKDINKIKKLG